MDQIEGYVIFKRSCVSDFWRDGRWHFPLLWKVELVRVWDFIEQNFVVNMNARGFLFCGGWIRKVNLILVVLGEG